MPPPDGFGLLLVPVESEAKFPPLIAVSAGPRGIYGDLELDGVGEGALLVNEETENCRRRRLVAHDHPGGPGTTLEDCQLGQDHVVYALATALDIGWWAASDILAATIASVNLSESAGAVGIGPESGQAFAEFADRQDVSGDQESPVCEGQLLPYEVAGFVREGRIPPRLRESQGKILQGGLAAWKAKGPTVAMEFHTGTQKRELFAALSEHGVLVFEPPSISSASGTPRYWAGTSPEYVGRLIAMAIELGPTKAPLPARTAMRGRIRDDSGWHTVWSGEIGANGYRDAEISHLDLEGNELQSIGPSAIWAQLSELTYLATRSLLSRDNPR